MDSLTANPPTLRTGTTARILYVNGNGQTSERTITIEHRFTSGRGVTYLVAYCHLRGEQRTFRLDRVMSVLDTHAARPGAEARRAAARPAAHRAPTPTTGPSAQPRRAGHASEFLGKLVVGALAVTCLAWFRAEANAPTDPPRFRPPPVPTVAAANTEPSPKDATWSDEYRGQEIRVERRGDSISYTLVASDRRFGDMHSLRIAVNESLLSASMGIRDDRLTGLFARADRDRDGSLSWSEVEAFQHLLDDRYRYLANDVALWPSQFMDAGGGDCEDWALMTATLLRFWGIDAEIGSIHSDTGHHAVTFVPVSGAPSDFLQITIGGTDDSPATTYVPIDYTRVGGFSNAVGGSYTVTRVRRPEELFGTAM
ncbi:MAG: WYL domain-containing protein [Spirochaetota bacterium]